MKWKFDELDWFKILNNKQEINFCSEKDPVRNLNEKLQFGRKHFQTTYLIKFEYLQYVKNSDYSIENFDYIIDKIMNHYIKEDADMVNMHVKRCSTLLDISKTQKYPQSYIPSH